MNAPHVQRTWFDDLFNAIDTTSWHELPRFFHPQVVYERPGYAPIVGLEELLSFYASTRIIAEGKHSLEGSLQNDDQAICWGQFNGRSKNGEPLAERFADAYRLQDGLIKQRTTYFFRAAI